MSKDAFFLGKPVEFKTGIYVYPPTVDQVICDAQYSLFSRLLTYSQEEIEDIFVKEKKELTSFPTPMEFLLSNCYHSQECENLTKKAFKFFLHNNVEFLYEQKTIIIGDLDQILNEIKDVSELVLIGEDEFFSFQNLIRNACSIKEVEAPNPDEHPKIKAMKAKARYRDKIKAQQAAKNGTNLFSTLTAICCMNFGLNPLNIGEITYVAMVALMEMYQGKEKYDLDIRSLLAGADHKKIKPIYWIKNLED